MSLQETHLRAHYTEVRNRLHGSSGPANGYGRNTGAPTALSAPSPPVISSRKFPPVSIFGNFEVFTGAPWNTGWDHLKVEKGKRYPRVAFVTHVVADFYGFNIELIKGPHRLHAYIFPRQMAMYLARELTGRSMAYIGWCIGGRDHSTISHGVAKIRRAILGGHLMAEKQAQDIESIIVEASEWQ